MVLHTYTTQQVIKEVVPKILWLVCQQLDETTSPKKVFTDQYEALRWARRQMTKPEYEMCEFLLYKQDMTRSTATVDFVKYIHS